MQVKVKNLRSKRTGREIPNQFEIHVNGSIFFQSYKSIICCIEPDGVVTLDPRYWKYSVTTGRYRNQFLGENKRATERKIKSGEYFLLDLNN